MPIVPSYYAPFSRKGLYGISIPILTDVAASDVATEIAAFDYKTVIVAWSEQDMFIATANYIPDIMTRHLGDTYNIWFSGGYLTIPQFKFSQTIDYRNEKGTLTNLCQVETQICSPIQMVFNSLEVITTEDKPTDDEYYLVSRTSGSIVHIYYHRFTLANLARVYVWDGVDYKTFPIRVNQLSDLNEFQA